MIGGAADRASGPQCQQLIQHAHPHTDIDRDKHTQKNGSLMPGEIIWKPAVEIGYTHPILLAVGQIEREAIS